MSIVKSIIMFFVIILVMSICAFIVLPVFIRPLLYVRDCKQLAEDYKQDIAVDFHVFWEDDYDTGIVTENAGFIELSEVIMHPDRLREVNIYDAVNFSRVSRHPEGIFTAFQINLPSDYPDHLTICNGNRVLKVLNGYYSVPVFNYDGSRFATYNHSEEEYLIYDSQSLEVAYRFNYEVAGRLALHPTEPILAVLTSDYRDENRYRNVILWNYETGTQLNTITLDIEALTLTFNSSGTALMFIPYEYDIRIWTVSE